jgi:hypothetical protein
MIPERIQAIMSHIGDGRPRAMLADTMKIPDPIIDPATSIVPSVRDIALTNPGLDCGVASVVTAELLMQGIGMREGDRRQRAGGASVVIPKNVGLRRGDR